MQKYISQSRAWGDAMMSRKQVNRKRESTVGKLVASGSKGTAVTNGERVASGGSSGVDASKTEDLSADQIKALDCIDLSDAEIDSDAMNPGMEIQALEPDPPQEKKGSSSSKPTRTKVTTKQKEGKKAAAKTERRSGFVKEGREEMDRKKRLLKLARQDAKTEFEEEKESILSKVPGNIQDLFGQLGFARWNKNFLPALILSPYSVPPGPARNIWLEMYHKV